MPPLSFGLRSALTVHQSPSLHQLGELGDVVALLGLVVGDVAERLGLGVEGEDARRPLAAAPSASSGS